MSSSSPPRSPSTRKVFVRRTQASPTRRKSSIKLPTLGPKRVWVARKIRPGQTLQLHRAPGGTVSMPESKPVLALPEAIVRSGLRDNPVVTAVDDRSADRSNVLGDVDEFKIRASKARVGDQDESAVEEERREAFEQRMQELRRARRFEEQRDRDELRSLLCGEKILATREGRIFRRWKRINRVWQRNREHISSVVGNNSGDLAMDAGNDFRERVEAYDLIHKATPLHKKFGSSYWKMTLRGEATNFVQVGNVFSGLYCEIKCNDSGFNETIRRHRKAPRMKQPSWKTSNAFLKRQRELRKHIAIMRPHIIENVDGLIVEGRDLFNLDPPQLPKYSDGRDLIVQPPRIIVGETIEPRPPTTLKPAGGSRNNLLKQQRSSAGAIVVGPSLKLQQNVLVFECEVGNIGTGSVRVSNVGSTAMYYTWKKQGPPIFRSSQVHLGDEYGFQWARTKGVLLPGASAALGFSFRAPKRPGIFLETVQMETVPALQWGSPVLLLKGIATMIDQDVAARDEFANDIQGQEKAAMMRSILQSIVENVRESPAVPEDVMFYRRNHEEPHRLWFYPDVLQELQELSETLRTLLSRRARQSARWDLRVDTLQQTIASLDGERATRKEEFQATLDNLIARARVRPTPNASDCSDVSAILSEFLYCLPELRFRSQMAVQTLHEGARLQAEQEKVAAEAALRTEREEREEKDKSSAKKGKGKAAPVEPVKDAAEEEAQTMNPEELHELERQKQAQMLSETDEMLQNMASGLLRECLSNFSVFERGGDTDRSRNHLIELARRRQERCKHGVVVWGDGYNKPLLLPFEAISAASNASLSVFLTGDKQVLCLRNTPEPEVIVEPDTHDAGGDAEDADEAGDEDGEHEGDNEDDEKDEEEVEKEVLPPFTGSTVTQFDSWNARSVIASDTETIVIAEKGDVVSLVEGYTMMKLELDNHDIVKVVLAMEDGSVRVALDGSGTVWTWASSLLEANAEAKALLGRRAAPPETDADNAESAETAVKKTMLFLQSPDAISTQYLNDIVDISAGDGHVLALDKDGCVYSWGSNTHGQLGREEGEGFDIPGKVSLGEDGRKAGAISAGAHHSLVLSVDGKVFSCGQSEGGLLGLGADIEENVREFTLVQSLSGEKMQKISAGSKCNMVLSESGHVFVWGSLYRSGGSEVEYEVDVSDDDEESGSEDEDGGDEAGDEDETPEAADTAASEPPNSKDPTAAAADSANADTEDNEAAADTALIEHNPTLIRAPRGRIAVDVIAGGVHNLILLAPNPQ